MMASASNRSTAVVIGGGLVGCAVAAELRRRGHDVTLLERAVPGLRGVLER